MNKKTIVMALLAPLAVPGFAGKAQAGTTQMTAQAGVKAQVGVQYGTPVQAQYPYQPPVQYHPPVQYQPPVQQQYPYQRPVQYPYGPIVQTAPPAERPYGTYSVPRDSYGRRIPRPTLRSYTELRLAQFRDGRVFVYDRDQLIGSFDRAANLRVIEGRAYGIVVTRGGRVMWQGQVLATPGSVLVHLNRNGTPVIERRPAPPQRTVQYDAYYRPLDHDVFRGACREVDVLPSDPHRLGWMRQTFQDRPVSLSQAGELLGHLSFESSRLAALELLAPNIVGSGDERWLLGHFASFEARARASAILGLR